MKQNQTCSQKMIMDMVKMAMAVQLYEDGQRVIGAGRADIPTTLEPLWRIHSIVRFFAGYPEPYDYNKHLALCDDDTLDAILDEYETVLRKHVAQIQNGRITDENAEHLFADLCSAAEKYK